jgi:16S rRNA (adenine1518-N6/adenine1519-N6)-dimethyltransferase
VTLKQRLLDDLAQAGVPPLHRFGQNFMVDERALDALVAELELSSGVRVAEIGPGTGLLTSRLLDVGARVLAVEIDRGLCAHLERTLVPRGLELVQGDCLQGKSRLHPALEAFAAAGEWRFGSNLPYDVALPAILNAAALPRQPSRLVATVQLEAGERLCSRPGSDAWGASAAVLQAAGAPRLVRRLPPSCFHPPPRVDSAIIAWTPTRALPPGFGAWCRRLFSARRKVLPGALRDGGMTRADAEAACRSCGLDPSRRVENLDAGELLALHAACVQAPGTSDSATQRTP